MGSAPSYGSSKLKSCLNKHLALEVHLCTEACRRLLTTWMKAKMSRLALRCSKITVFKRLDIANIFWSRGTSTLVYKYIYIYVRMCCLISGSNWSTVDPFKRAQNPHIPQNSVHTLKKCFQKSWYPQIINFNRIFHYKPSILGYPYFWKHPCIPCFCPFGPKICH